MTVISTTYAAIATGPRQINFKTIPNKGLFVKKIPPETAGLKRIYDATGGVGGVGV